VLAVLLACGANVRLIRVGRLLPHKSLALAHALGVERAVVELGHVSDDRLAELYNAADVLLFPSLYEGFGWPVLEAMAAGTPVVVSTCPALSELVGDAALKRPATDIRGLSEAVLDILRSPSLARHLRYAGIERARGFSWRATMAGYELAYQNAIENRRLSATD
jgi:glycosyltransferase involved in cell wall biosynthesis